MFRTDISRLRNAIVEYNKIARAFELYNSIDPMLRKERWNCTQILYPMSHCVHCLCHARRYELDNRLPDPGTFEDWAFKLVQLLWLGCNSEPKCLHCHIGLSEHPATKCGLCKKKVPLQVSDSVWAKSDFWQTHEGERPMWGHLL